MNPTVPWFDEMLETLRLDRELRASERSVRRARSAKGLRPKPAKQAAKPRFKSCKWG